MRLEVGGASNGGLFPKRALAVVHVQLEAAGLASGRHVNVYKAVAICVQHNGTRRVVVPRPRVDAAGLGDVHEHAVCRCSSCIRAGLACSALAAAAGEQQEVASPFSTQVHVGAPVPVHVADGHAPRPQVQVAEAALIPHPRALVPLVPAAVRRRVGSRRPLGLGQTLVFGNIAEAQCALLWSRALSIPGEAVARRMPTRRLGQDAGCRLMQRSPVARLQGRRLRGPGCVDKDSVQGSVHELQ
mmetsp:Transcript_11648/g.45316  ORF Transcript_11648/g.45316 Transcript_11648/m.45316 type:complete len:243 (+) Transcript_11648:4067-4795(+)